MPKEKTAFAETIEKLEKISFLLPVLFIIAQALGYVYNIEYLNFFSINKDFYYFNIFDLVPLIINFIIFSILILIIIDASGYIKYCFEDIIVNIFEEDKTNKEEKNEKEKINFFKFRTKKLKPKEEIITILKDNKIIKRFIYIFILIALYSSALVFFTQGNLKGWGNVLSTLCTHSLLLGISRTIFSTLNNKRNNDNNDNSKMFDIICFLIIVTFSLTLIVKNLGEIEAKSKKNFNLINNNQIILYNTPDYAIIAQYTYDEKNNTANIYTDELSKIDLTNLKFKNHTFKEVNIIRE